MKGAHRLAIRELNEASRSDAVAAIDASCDVEDPVRIRSQLVQRHRLILAGGIFFPQATIAFLATRAAWRGFTWIRKRLSDHPTGSIHALRVTVTRRELRVDSAECRERRANRRSKPRRDECLRAPIGIILANRG